MVEVTFTGKCKGCPSFEPSVKRVYSVYDQCYTAVSCGNSQLCEHLERYLKETLSNEQKENG